MLIEIKRLFYLINSSLILLLFSCNRNTSGNLLIMNAELHETESIKQYPPTCYISNNEVELKINYALNYFNGNLIEYITPGAEGLIIDKLGGERGYPIKYSDFKKLYIRKNNDSILLFERNYRINRRNKDTIFVETENKGEYLILVGESVSN